jgi:hypothetical protein
MTGAEVVGKGIRSLRMGKETTEGNREVGATGRRREELGAERVRREQEAERERDELRAQLEALHEARDDPETASEVAEWIDAPLSYEGPDTSTKRRRAYWWRRYFGFDNRGHR